MKTYRFVGLDADVALPDDIAVEVAIVPAHVRNVRSNQPFGGQTSMTWHETANFNAGADAEMHKRWLHGGAGGAYVGFNFVVDDHKIIQLTPLNEVTWAAGTVSGNRNSWHVEQCVNSDADLDRARRNTAALFGGLAAAKGWDVRKTLVQHHVWYGKNCPLVIRRDNLWGRVVAMAAEFRTKASQGGGTTPATPAYAAPAPIPDLADRPPAAVLGNGAVLLRAPLLVRAVRETPRRRWAHPQSEPIGPDLARGDTFRVDYLIINPDGSLYWYTPYATRIAYDDVQVVEEAA